MQDGKSFMDENERELLKALKMMKKDSLEIFCRKYMTVSSHADCRL